MNSLPFPNDILNIINEYAFFKPKTKKELQDTINFYCEDKKEGIHKYGIINTWDVSHITNMSFLFGYKKEFNEPINNWNTSQVTDMSYMFFASIHFYQILK